MKEDAIKLDEKKSKDWKDLFEMEVTRYFDNFYSLDKNIKDAIILKGLQRKVSELYNTASKKIEAIKQDKIELTSKRAVSKLSKQDEKIVKKILKQAKDNKEAILAIKLALGQDKLKFIKDKLEEYK